MLGLSVIVVSERWIITATYGRCVEGLRRDESALANLLDRCARRGAPATAKELAPFLVARAEWAALMREVPNFTSEVVHGR